MSRLLGQTVCANQIMRFCPRKVFRGVKLDDTSDIDLHVQSESGNLIFFKALVLINNNIFIKVLLILTQAQRVLSYHLISTIPKIFDGTSFKEYFFYKRCNLYDNSFYVWD